MQLIYWNDNFNRLNAGIRGRSNNNDKRCFLSSPISIPGTRLFVGQSDAPCTGVYNANRTIPRVIDRISCQTDRNSDRLVTRYIPKEPHAAGASPSTDWDRVFC